MVSTSFSTDFIISSISSESDFGFSGENLGTSDIVSFSLPFVTSPISLTTVSSFGGKSGFIISLTFISSIKSFSFCSGLIVSLIVFLNNYLIIKKLL